MSLPSPICLLSLGSPNCQSQTLPSCQLHVTNATLPIHQVYWTTQNALKCYKLPNIAWNVFFGGPNLAPKSKATQFSHISKGLKTLFVSINFVSFMTAHPNFIHKIPSTKIHNKIICFMLVISCVSSIYLLPNSTLPNGEVEVTIWLFYKINFFGLSNPLCQIADSTGPNCQVHVAKSAFPSYQCHIIKATLPNCQVQICFVNCPRHKNFLGCPRSECFQVCWNYCPKNSDCFDPPPPPRLLSFFWLDGFLKLEKSPFKIQTI